MWKPFGRAVGAQARHDERGEAAGTVGRAVGPREHDEDLGVDVRAEVLLAVEAPLGAVAHRARRVRADVAAALALGEEHAAFPRLVGVEARQAATRSRRAPPSGA